MSIHLDQLLDLAVQNPKSLAAEIVKLSNVDRRTLLNHAASGESSRRLAAAYAKHGSGKVSILSLEKGVATFHARTSLPAVPAFDFHFFKDAHGNVWGRTEISVATFLGPGYFGVTEGKELRNELTLDFDRVPPADAVPKGWPPVQSNASALSAMLFQGVSIRVRGSAGGLLTGSVWRNGRDQGTFVNLVRAA